MNLHLNLIHLANFIKVVEWGNISKAATHLNIAQPALSRQIQALEAELNTKLLRRHKMGVEPTEDGKLLLEHAHRIEKECISARDSIRSNRDNPIGSVYLGIPTAYSVSLGPPLIRRMRDIYPNISVHIVEGFSSAVFEWLISGRLDLAILYQSQEHNAGKSSPFLTEEMVALTPPHMFKDLTTLSLEDLAHKQIIIPRQPHFLRRALDAKFQELAIPFVPKLEIDSLRCMIEMAHLGEGVAILAPSCVAREISEGRLKGTPLNPSLKLTTVLGETPSRQQSRVVGIVA
ncbi:MAG: LysR family transcriptional regulator, partial [Rhizobiaceae bacterium]|nr:LysR family transcriptional regulator [Rhizobiaceae bacterium]